ncbi:hypothetical protein EYC80_001811 [Monilinia laxa]|uniref:Helicase C-terminal domain-containing protein n=1 Tax=Monilinia laxa TaxID=61186 RepID=A0A5N6K641_MONLA|nr:hypothetical protein EYC80_001811 [Monilinia laxa]
MLRRTKTSPGVDLGLPPMEEVLLFVPLTPLQKLWYERLIKKTDTAILHELFDTNSTQEPTTMANLALESTSAGNSNSKKRITWQSLMNLVIQLRKVCNHPYQIEDAEPDPYFTGQHLIEASGKFIVLEKLVTELVVEQKKKIIIFSGFTKMLDLVQELLILKGGDGSKFNTCRIDGSTGRARRNLATRMFMDLTSNYNVFLISTRAGGLGLNLAAASEILLLDQDWNPQVTKQAIGRAYRIGLQKPLTVYQFVAQGTVEEQMMPRIAKKLYLSAKVTESMEDIYTQPSASSQAKRKEISNGDDTDMPEMNMGQLMNLIRRGASAISRPEIDVNKMLEWDWKTTIAMCKDQASDSLMGKNIAGDSNVDEEETEKQWLAERERVQSRLFNGETIEGHRPKSSQPSQDFEPSSSKADRRIGKERTVMMDGYMVSKDTINNSQWEAVKTFSSTNATSSVSKREKKPDIKSQAYCQVCKIDHKSLLISCKFCPRAYHNDCLTPYYQEKVKKFQFACPQHLCADCKQKAGDVGGMLYKCRWCPKAQCEDCIDWINGFKPLGDSLPELDLLGFPKASSAFYVHCKDCSEKLKNDGEFKDLCESLKKQWAKDLEKLDAVDVAFHEKIGESGSIDMPIFIDNDSDVEDLVEVPATKVARKQGVGATNGLRGHHGHQGARISPSNVSKQAGNSTRGSQFTFPKRQENGRKRSFMDKWTEPPAPPALHGCLGNAFNAPRRIQQLTGNTPVSTSAMRTAGTGMWMFNGKYGYGRQDGQATNNPYFLSQFGSNVEAQDNLSSALINSRQLGPYYASPHGAYMEGYDNMSNVPGPRLLGEYTPPQHSAPPSEVNPGGRVGISNIPRLSGQPKSDIAPMRTTPFHLNISHQANPGRKRSYMDKWMEAPSGDN